MWYGFDRHTLLVAPICGRSKCKAGCTSAVPNEACLHSQRRFVGTVDLEKEFCMSLKAKRGGQGRAIPLTRPGLQSLRRPEDRFSTCAVRMARRYGRDRPETQRQALAGSLRKTFRKVCTNLCTNLHLR